MSLEKDGRPAQPATSSAHASRLTAHGSPMLTLSSISKSYGPLLALDDVSLDVAAGEVHALLGENGAGKTTLMHVAYGLVRPDRGEVRAGAAGRPLRQATPFAARAAGIGLVHQHFTSIPAFTVAENIGLTAGWPETGAALVARAEAAIARLGLPLDARRPAGALTAQLRQRLEIVKALASGARILLLDEPSAVLAPREVGELLERLRGFAADGGAVVLITHKLEEVLAVADRVTVLRRGRVVLRGTVAEESAASLVRAMLGEADGVAEPVRGVSNAPGAIRARVTHHGRPLELRAGEIVGIAAIEGNGQRALLRAVAGVERHEGIAVALEGTVVLVPEDRTTEGMLPDFTVAENFLLGTWRQYGRWIDRRRLERTTADAIARYDVRAAGPGVRMGALSGGNQQKLVLARALAAEPAVIVAEDPTRGLDVRAAAAVHRRLREAADAGAAVLVHASDLDEVLRLADRVVAIAEGVLYPLPAGATRDQVGDAMLGRGVDA